MPFGYFHSFVCLLHQVFHVAAPQSYRPAKLFSGRLVRILRSMWFAPRMSAGACAAGRCHASRVLDVNLSKTCLVEADRRFL